MFSTIRNPNIDLFHISRNLLSDILTMPCTVQVCDNSGSKFVHLLSEVNRGKSVQPIAFVQTNDGVESISTGAKHFSGDVRHRFSGTFAGEKEDYIAAVQKAGTPFFSSQRMLERVGLTNLKRGSGAVITVQSLMQVGTCAAAALTAVQVAYLWHRFAADGVFTQEEVVRMGLELCEFGNPMKAVKEVGSACFSENNGILDAAADDGRYDAFVNNFIDRIQGDDDVADASPLRGTEGEFNSGFDERLGVSGAPEEPSSWVNSEECTLVSDEVQGSAVEALDTDAGLGIMETLGDLFSTFL